MRAPLVLCVAAVFHTIFVASREDHEVSTRVETDEIILSSRIPSPKSAVGDSSCEVTT